MRKIIADTEISSSGYAARTLKIGKVGENLATVIIFPTADWVETFGQGGEFELVVRAPTETTPYYAVLDTETYDDSVAWMVRGYDLVNPGYGVCELRYYVNYALAKSATYKTIVEASTPSDDWRADEIMRIERGQNDGHKTFVTLYGEESEILAADMSRYATGSFGITPALDVYFFTEPDSWTKNGEAI